MAAHREQARCSRSLALALVQCRSNTGGPTLGLREVIQTLSRHRNAGSLGCTRIPQDVLWRTTSDWEEKSDGGACMDRQPRERICTQQINDHKVPCMRGADGVIGVYEAHVHEGGCRVDIERQVNLRTETIEHSIRRNVSTWISPDCSGTSCLRY